MIKRLLRYLFGFPQGLSAQQVPTSRGGIVADEKDKTGVSDKWRQGDIVPDDLAYSILSRLADDKHCGPLRGFTYPGILVLVSQSCDLIQPSWDKEPFAEAIWGTSAPEAKVPDVQSPRAIQLPESDEAKSAKYIFEDRNRIVLPRKWMVGHVPSGRRMQPDGLRKLIRMVIRRYDRQPLPTEFVNRLKRAGVANKINKLLRGSMEDLSGVTIYLRLNTGDEPTPENSVQDYVAYPLAVYKLEKEDQAKEAHRKKAADEVMHGNEEAKEKDSYKALGLVGLLKRCSSHGIQILDPNDLDDPFFRQCDHVLSERFFTLDHRYEFKPWEFDYLSPDDDDSKPLSMYSS